MKTQRTSLALLLAIVGAPLLVALNTSCVGPAGRSQIRQETRVENRVEHRQERRRGW